MVIPQHPFRS
jgi:hypothetical protein